MKKIKYIRYWDHRVYAVYYRRHKMMCYNLEGMKGNVIVLMN